jgi:calcium-binding protein CML
LGKQVIFFWTQIVRQLLFAFDKLPQHLMPVPTPIGDELQISDFKKTALSQSQAAQIHEIFDLFDTDDTGTIDGEELQFAMSALGFQTEGSANEKSHQEEQEMVNTLISDGKVTLEEFSALMTGELGKQDPYEEARMAFTVLSRSDGDVRYNRLITLNKLEAVCMEYKVSRLPACPLLHGESHIGISVHTDCPPDYHQFTI